MTADIADYLKEKKDVLLFADLVQRAIKKEYDDFNRFIDGINRLNEFHNKLLEYANELPDNAAPQ